MLNDLFELFVRVFTFFMALVGAIALLCFLSSLGPLKWSCEDLSKQTGLQTSYSIWNTCMVKMPNGEFITKDAYEAVMQKKFELTIKQ